jgi:SSS family transporter
MQPIDWLVALAYLAGVVALGLWLGRRQQGAADYFLGRHSLPWWAVLVSVVATETSALTVISVPGIGYRTNLNFLQLAFGYLIGRTAVALWLLPRYFEGTMETAYHVLGSRWGLRVRRTSSALFMLTRTLGDSVRLFATAIPLALITGWSYPASIVVLGLATLAYTYTGGLRAVVWADVIQWFVYVLAGAAALYMAVRLAPPALAVAQEVGKLKVFDFSLSLSRPYAFFTAIIGGAFLSAASHGTDHLIVQRLLSTRGLTAARITLIGSGVVVIAQFALFLVAGAALWVAFPEGGSLSGDEVFPAFITAHLGGGLAGLAVAGILAAAMSTVASSLNSLASAATHDFYASATGRTDEAHLLRVGRLFTLAWAVVLIGGALLFRQRDTPVVVVALSIASLTYGALLGAFILARFPTVRERDAVLALVSGAVLMAVVVFAGALAPLLGDPAWLVTLGRLAWPWYVPIGTAITVGIGLASSLTGAQR